MSQVNALRIPLEALSQPATTSRIQSVVAAHGVLALPTETFYALSASVFDLQALQRLRKIKEQPKGKPLLLLIGNISQLSLLVSSIPSAAQTLMDQFWPGPLTLVFPAQPHLHHEVTGGTSSIGIRLLAPGPVSRLLEQIGPVTGTSANRSGHPPPQQAQRVMETFGEDIDLILEQELPPGNQPSTLIDTREPVRYLREGPISFDQVRAALTSQ